MAFGAEDIKKKMLTTAFRGYKVKEVDDFLDLVASEFDKLQTENEKLHRRIHEMEHAAQAVQNHPNHSIEERLEELERRLQAQ